MKYNKNHIEIFKRVIKDYNKIKEIIDLEIKNGKSMEELKWFLIQNVDCNITNCKIDNEDVVFNYIDFNYKDMCISLLEYDDIGVYLGETLEIWDDDECSYIGTFNNTRELEDIIKEYESRDENE